MCGGQHSAIAAEAEHASLGLLIERARRPASRGRPRRQRCAASRALAATAVLDHRHHA
jgi:hypothetical protein